MVRVRGLRIISLILSVMMFVSLITVPAGAAEGEYNGIYVMNEGVLDDTIYDLERDNPNNNKFKVYIKSPALTSDADDVYVYVQYDPEVLQFVSWDKIISGFGEDKQQLGPEIDSSTGLPKNNGSFALVVSTAPPKGSTDLPQVPLLGRGLDIEATLMVKPTAKTTQTTVTLTRYDISLADRSAEQNPPTPLWDTTGIQEQVTINIKRPTFPITSEGDGISVNKEIVDNDDTLEVNVDIPAIAWNADDPKIKIEYDDTAFDFKGWKTGIGTPIENNNEHWFGLRLSNDDLDKPLHLVAELTPKSSGTPKDCTFTLIPDMTEAGEDLWDPDNETATVRVTGLPDTTGGITIEDPARVQRGETFDVKIKVPKLEQQVDTVSIKAVFDPTQFEVVSWTPSIPGADINADFSNSEGTFFLTANTGSASIDLHDGFTFTAKMRAKKDSERKNHTIKLTDAKMTRQESGRTQRVWQPAKVTADIEVYDVYPVTEGGISLSTPTVGDEGSFRVNVKIPEIYTAADRFTVTVNYNPDVFEITSLDSDAANVTTSRGASSFTFSSDGTDVGLKNGITLSADIKVKPDVDSGNYKFSITDYKVFEGDTELWIPKTKEAEIKVAVTGDTPAAGGGIRATKSLAEYGDTFNVIVEVPSIPFMADTADIAVLYESTVFEVLQVEPSVSNVAVTNEPGRFGIASAGDSISLSDPLKITAQVRVRDGAAKGNHSFLLSKNVLTRTKATGKEQVLWKPTSTSAPVYVSDGTENPTAGGGLSLSDSVIDAGDTVTVTVRVPGLEANVGNARVKVDFDGTKFEVRSLSSSVSGFTSSDGEGYFTFTATDADISLKDGVVFTAKLKSSTSASGNYGFRLSESNMLSKDLATALWIPSNVSETLKVNGKTVDPADDDDFPVTGGSITLSQSQIKPGDTVAATVRIPPMQAEAEDLYIMVDFNSSAFDVVSWSPSVRGGIPTYGSGYFSLSAADTSVDLSNGLTLTANLRARSGANDGSYTFRLTNSDVYGTPYSESLYQRLWTPYSTADTVRIYSGSTPASQSQNGGGISVSRSEVYTGDVFTVYVNVPSVNDWADAASMRVDYDPNVFELVSWDPGVNGCSATNGYGYFGLESYSNAAINMNYGFTFYATLRAKNYANLGRYSLNLSRASFTSGGTRLWNPTSNTAYVTVTSYSVYSGYNYPWNQLPPPPPDNRNNNTNNNNNKPTTPSNDDKSDIEYIDDDDDDSSRRNSIYDDDDDYTPPDAPDYDDYDDEQPDGQTNIPAHDVSLQLNTDLTEIRGKNVNIVTKYRFFTDKTLIFIRNTEQADRCAEAALNELGMSDHKSYAFDISVYNVVTGEYIHSLPGGYIDFNIPIPTSLASSPSTLLVYHVENGVPEYIDSSVIYEDGQQKLHFRANSFSPYMFVDTLNLKQSGYTPSTSGVNRPDANITINSGSSGSGIDRNANPNTGSAAIIVIPAAIGGCLLLAKKDKKRKRSSRR